MQAAKAQYQQTGCAARLFKEFIYQTRESWSRARRVVANAEHLEKGEKPRFVVTSLSVEEWPAQALYEQCYCARGDMENRIKEQLMLFSDRTSTHYLRSNQLRLYFSSIAYCCCRCCGDWDCRERSWPRPSAPPFGSSCSRLVR